MKSLNSFLYIFAVVLFISCSSDDDTSDSNSNAQQGELAAQVNGEAFTSSQQSTSAFLQQDVLNITGVNEASDRIAFLINNFSEVGEFDLSGFTTVATAIYIPSGATVFFTTENEGGEGSITITEIDETEETISGTFSFTAIRQTTNDSGETTFEEVQVSGGSFSNVSVPGIGG